ncbi:hypothetical protein E4T56_gene15170, partial [Termitomyces sp. T112]
EFNGNAARLADTVTHALRQHQMMAVAGREIAAGLRNADDRASAVMSGEAGLSNHARLRSEGMGKGGLLDVSDMALSSPCRRPRKTPAPRQLAVDAYKHIYHIKVKRKDAWMANSMIRLGLVGLGKIARDQHLPAITANPRFALTATADPQGGLEGIASYSSLDALLDARLALDAVVLCTPPSVRAGLAHRALEAGLHVMLEKPPAVELSQVEAMVACAQRMGRSLMATWHSRDTAAVDA